MAIMTAQTVRWGILGTGGIAATFASDLPHVPGATLAAVGSRTPEAAATFAGKHGAARAHGSWADLAADPDVDVIYVATPHASHHAAALACHRALGCRHYSLFDFRVDPAGRVWFLEASPYCSFARASVVAVMAAAAGIGVGDLFATAVEQAVRTGHAVAENAH